MNWPFWFELFVRSGALLLAGELLRRLSKRSGPDFRHRLLLWVFVLLTLLPLFSVLLPEIPISLWRNNADLNASVTIREVSSRILESQATRQLNWPVMIWMSGFVVACMPLLVGSFSAWRITRRAIELSKPEFASLARKLAGSTDVLVSTRLRVPVTCGLTHTRILLPLVAQDWSAARLEAVILHELAHVRRRDVLAQILTHLVAAMWWFQPLVWMLHNRLRQESEFACDSAAIRSGLLPSAYAAELLGVAESASQRRQFSSVVIGMVRPTGLEERLRVILQPPSLKVGHRRIYAVVFLLGAISIAASAVNFRNGSDTKEGSTMKRTILSALLTSAGLSAATVTGYIHDTSGTAVADAKVSIYNPDNSVKQEAVTGSDGKFNLSGNDGGLLILRAEKPGFASIFREFDLKADAALNREFTMAPEGNKGVPDSMIGPSADRPKHLRVGGEVAQSNLIKKVQPKYPPLAKKAGIQGTVEISATISKEGVPVELQVISSPSDDLSEESLEAVRQWRYRPTLLNGEPVEIETVVKVSYTLSK